MSGEKVIAGGGCLVILIILVALIAVIPLCLLWGVNLILGEMGLATIPITLKSWFGAWLIGMVLSAKSSYSKSS